MSLQQFELIPAPLHFQQEATFTPPFDFKEEMVNHFYSPCQMSLSPSMPSPPCSVPEQQPYQHLFSSGHQQQAMVPQSPVASSGLFDCHNSLGIIENARIQETLATDQQQIFGKVFSPESVGSNSTSPVLVDNAMSQQQMMANMMHNSQHPQDLNLVTVQPTQQQQVVFIYDNNSAVSKNNSDRSPYSQKHSDKAASTSVNARKFQDMSREQLIARLVVLENEKHSSTIEDSIKDASSLNSPEEEDTPLNEEEEDDSFHSPTEHTTLTCLWTHCGRKFDVLQKLITHITELHVGGGKATYRCEWENCPRSDKPFTKRHKMYNHLRTHTGERPFVCPKPECEKKFSRPDSLTTHIKTHSNVRPFVCGFKGCGKAYYHSRSLKKHERVHESCPSSSQSTVSTPPAPLVLPQLASIPYNNSVAFYQPETPTTPTTMMAMNSGSVSSFSTPTTPVIFNFPVSSQSPHFNYVNSFM